MGSPASVQKTYAKARPQVVDSARPVLCLNGRSRNERFSNARTNESSVAFRILLTFIWYFATFSTSVALTRGVKMSCEKDLELARIEKASAHAELNTLSREIPKYRAEITRLKGELASSEEQTRDLRGQLESVQAHNQDLLNQSLSLQVQILALQAETETLRNQIQNQKS
jgi:hypothetical protein